MELLEDYFPTWYSRNVQDDDQLPGVMVINGYNPGTKLKSVIHDIVSVVVSEEDKERGSLRMPKHVSEAFPFLMSYLKKNVTQSKKNNIVKPKLVLVIHNIDGEPFREERAQIFLSQLASLPNVWLLVSTDHINVGLLWDLYRFKNFSFLWHEVTTHEAYRVEMSFKDVLSVGKSRKFVGTKGVKHVLTSLTANAKNLYKILLKMQLEKIVEMTASKSARTGLRGNPKLGLDLQDAYDKCVQEYIASNRTNFNTMLHEFVEHKMCSLARSKAGGDIVFIPFTYDEMEKIVGEEFAN
ncbi:origin recognition complex subunit 2 [Metschnikowia bicuspidata var. bicuspidata NRRL YB-4993]|uniref:Origin recognition complex subunit 2 n=1 Tax=Metschnikowia bicuspidata var. bicuspidata NRRL YB-4993 TaxID=869754 RepID=A0A1A0H4I8_9ASCO|nr:origin recognition complex subunit 2 [Metschnikowia bicuspidata var. bicuspidata NRRL YB-4993]OBA18989.1 origin recognition complex subunit 2 [Metschnikowia bicuspidata var. bicuspidata NRRL YB-4993]